MLNLPKFRGAAAAAVLACAFICLKSASAQDDGERDALRDWTMLMALEDAVVKLVEEAEPSIVSVARHRRDSTSALPPDPFRLPDNRFPTIRRSTELSDPSLIPNEFGTGVIIAPDANSRERYILTNYHVVIGGPIAGQQQSNAQSELYVRLANRRGYSAEIVAADPRSDLAILNVDFQALGLSPEEVKPLRMARGYRFKKGRFVFGLGNPYAVARDGSASVSWGMISNIGRYPSPPGGSLDDPVETDKTIHHFGTLLHVDMRLNLGTSGGALVNRNGELIGITTSLSALAGYESSVGYAIPIDPSTRRAIDALMRGLEVEYGFLGVEPETISPAEFRRYSARFDQPSAVRIANVVEDSPADLGRVKEADIVLAVNDLPVFSHFDLIREIGRLGPEQSAALRVWRERTDQELILRVKLGKWPVYDDEQIIATRNRFPTWRGLRVDYPTARRKFIPRLQYPRAVVITEVEPSTPSAEAKLREGQFITHVNDTPVQTPADFARATAALSGKVTLRLHDGTHQTVSAN